MCGDELWECDPCDFCYDNAINYVARVAYTEIEPDKVEAMPEIETKVLKEILEKFEENERRMDVCLFCAAEFLRIFAYVRDGFTLILHVPTHAVRGVYIMNDMLANFMFAAKDENKENQETRGVEFEAGRVEINNQ